VDIVNYVARFLESWQVKDEHRHPAGFLRPHAILEPTWEVISMDFTIELSFTTRRHDSIVETIDTLMKSSHFFPLHMMHQAPSITRVYISKMLRLTDVPKKSYLIMDTVFAI
jgi:hypothetical protein